MRKNTKLIVLILCAFILVTTLTACSNTITSIMVTAPTKTDYYIGEEIDLTGGYLTVNYEEKASKKIELTARNVKVEGFNSTEAGSFEITVTYKKQTDKFTVNILETVIPEPEVTGIAIVMKPSKLVYEFGEELDLTGGVICISYDDGTEENAKMDDPMLTVTGFNAEEAGEQTIVVSYLGFEVEFTVAVNEAIPEELQYETLIGTWAANNIGEYVITFKANGSITASGYVANGSMYASFTSSSYEITGMQIYIAGLINGNNYFFALEFSEGELLAVSDGLGMAFGVPGLVYVHGSTEVEEIPLPEALYGKVWEGEAARSAFEFIFNTDGTITGTLVGTETYELTGTYTVDGDKIQLHYNLTFEVGYDMTLSYNGTTLIVTADNSASGVVGMLLVATVIESTDPTLFEILCSVNWWNARNALSFTFSTDGTMIGSLPGFLLVGTFTVEDNMIQIDFTIGDSPVYTMVLEYDGASLTVTSDTSGNFKTAVFVPVI